MGAVAAAWGKEDGLLHPWIGSGLCCGEEEQGGRWAEEMGAGSLAMARTEKEEGDVLLFGAGKGSCRASTAMEEQGAGVLPRSSAMAAGGSLLLPWEAGLPALACVQEEEGAGAPRLEPAPRGERLEKIWAPWVEEAPCAGCCCREQRGRRQGVWLVAAREKWRMGVQNCQFARERGAIYRRGTRVRVLNGPNWAGLGWPKHANGLR